MLLMEIRESCSSRLRLTKRSPATKKVARKCNAVERSKKETNVVEDSPPTGLQEQQVLIFLVLSDLLSGASAPSLQPSTEPT